MEPHSQLLVLLLGLFFAFMDAFALGANDGANSWATSVGARSIKLWQACVMAAIFEFLGAVLLGANVTETIRANVLDLTVFEDKPEILMLLMAVALVGSSSWVMLATRLEMPVSTTHSVIGAIVGAGIAAGGGDTVQWGWNGGKGLSAIVASWFISPVAAALVGAALFLVAKYAVLIWPNSFRRAAACVPFFFFFTFFVVTLFIVYKGAPGLDLGQLSLGIACAIAAGVGSLAAFLSVLPGYWLFMRWLRSKEAFAGEYEKLVAAKAGPEQEDDSIDTVLDVPGEEHSTDSAHRRHGSSKKLVETQKESQADVVVRLERELAAMRARYEPPTSPPWWKKDWRKRESFVELGRLVRKGLLHGVMVDVVDNTGVANIEDMHSRAAVYDLNTERLFSCLQVVTAGFASFAHGANDTSNAAGPLVTIWLIYDYGRVVLPSEPEGKAPIWIFVYCATALVLGLSLYGYNIMRALGNKLTLLSPSRGFSMELGTTITVLVASKIGVPVSTTHCITGATTGVGLCNGDLHAVNWRSLLIVFGGWMITLPAAGITSGLLMSLLIYTPCLQ